MKTLEKGNDKIQKISDHLRREALEPAHEEAKKIIEEARLRAEEIIAEAGIEAANLIEEAKKTIEQERNVFHSSLVQASRQSLEALKQEIEHNLFNEQLHKTLIAQTTNSQAIAQIINAVVKAVEKEGLVTDLSVVIPKAVSAHEVNQLLAEGVLKKIKEHTVTVGNFSGGAQVKLLDKNLTIDITEEALKELISKYIRKDFRKLIFAT